MKVALFALLLSIGQTMPPMPRQTVKNHAEKAGATTQVAKDSKQPAAPLASDAPVKISASENGTAKPASNHAQGTSPSTTKDESWSRAEKLSAVYDVLAGLLVVITGLGVCFALSTLRAIERQATIMRSQVTIPYRAYLGLIEPEKPLTDRSHNMNSAKFPIENTGHVRAKLTRIEVEVIVQALGGKELFRRSKVEEVKSDEGEIPPEKTSSYAITVLWPCDIPNAEHTVISIAITYKTGFRGVKPDVFSFVRVFRNTLQDWAKGYWGKDVDLTRANNHEEKAN